MARSLTKLHEAMSPLLSLFSYLLAAVTIRCPTLDQTGVNLVKGEKERFYSRESMMLSAFSTTTRGRTVISWNLLHFDYQS